VVVLRGAATLGGGKKDQKVGIHLLEKKNWGKFHLKEGESRRGTPGSQGRVCRREKERDRQGTGEEMPITKAQSVFEEG